MNDLNGAFGLAIYIALCFIVSYTIAKQKIKEMMMVLKNGFTI